MIRLTILAFSLGCWLGSSGVLSFGIESAQPIMQNVQIDLPLAQKATLSAFSTYTCTSQHSLVTDLPHAISPISPVNNLPLFSNLDLASNDGVITSADIASSLLKDYKNALDANPLRVKIITGCLLAIVGDAIAQSGQPEDYNKKRAAAFVAFDGAWRTVQQVTYGPIIETCNGKFSSSLLFSLPFANFQESLLQEENRIVLGAIEQTLVSQLVLIPLLYYPIFYSVTGAVQSLTVEETVIRAKETFVPLMKRNLLFWIPVQFCAFYFVEENLQIPVLTACGLVWTIILSLSAGNVNSSEEEKCNKVDSSTSIEEKMISEVSSSKGTVGWPRNFFDFRTNGTTYDEMKEDKIEESSVRAASPALKNKR